MTNKERAWELFYYWRDCLRKYAARNAITITLIAFGGVLTWAWILFANWIFA